jgi:phosphatidyl-myo-inositol dimannoside synthase
VGFTSRRALRNPVKIIFLSGEDYGGLSGIAQFNRDLIWALANCLPKLQVIFVSRQRRLSSAVDRPEVTLVPTTTKLSFVLAAIQSTLKIRPDLVICGHLYLLPAAMACQLVTRAPTWLITHGIEAWTTPRRLFVLLALKKIQRVLSVSSFTKDRLLTWAPISPDSIQVFPNAIDLNRFAPGSKPRYLEERYKIAGRKVILTVGRIDARERYKGHDVVLDVLQDLYQADPRIIYLVVGTGTDASRLKEKAVNLGLADRVIFAGQVPESEKVDHYRLADVFAMPGSGEGFGIVYLEAAACGVPVLGSRLDASQEVIESASIGLAVDPRSRVEVKEALVDLLARGHSAKPGVARFSRDMLAERTRSLIESLRGARARTDNRA